MEREGWEETVTSSTGEGRTLEWAVKRVLLYGSLVARCPVTKHIHIEAQAHMGTGINT